MDQTVSVWQRASFTVLATGYPFYYQWRKDGVDLAGATNATYILAFAQTNQAGNYTVVVSNAWGSTTSRAARLSVLPALITMQPQSTNFWLGGTASLSIQVQSAVPVSYQWQVNGVNLPGATNDGTHHTDIIPRRYHLLLHSPAEHIPS